MAPDAVVERFDVLEDLARQPVAGRPRLAVDEFLLQRREEALGDGIVVWGNPSIFVARVHDTERGTPSDGVVYSKGVVVASSTNPSRLRIGRLGGSASTWRYRKPRAAANAARCATSDRKTPRPRHAATVPPPHRLANSVPTWNST